MKHLKQASDTLMKIRKKNLLWNSYSPDGVEIWNIIIKLHVYKAREQKDYNVNEFYFSPSFILFLRLKCIFPTQLLISDPFF